MRKHLIGQFFEMRHFGRSVSQMELGYLFIAENEVAKTSFSLRISRSEITFSLDLPLRTRTPLI